MRAEALPVDGDDRGAADDGEEAFDAACDSKTANIRQVLDDLGHRLSERRRHQPVPGAPRRAVPGWVRWSVDRWAQP